MKSILTKFAENLLSRDEMKDLKGGNMPAGCMVIKRILFITIIFSISVFFDCVAQESFTIEGEINSNYGKISLIPAISPDSTELFVHIANPTVEVVDGRFEFEGKLEFPYPFIINFHDGNDVKYSSEFFVLKKGTQQIIIDRNSPIALVKNDIMNQYFSSNYFDDYKTLNKHKDWLRTFSDSISHQYGTLECAPDSLRNVIKLIEDNHSDREQSIVFGFCDLRTSELYSLWYIFVNLSRTGIKPVYDYCFKKFSPETKATSAGKLLENKLNAANIVGIGKTFPSDFYYENLKSRKREQLSVQSGKYTLVDFWYTRCGICIQQLKEHNEVYPKYKKKGFQLISIAGDWTFDLEKLDKIIKKYNFSWSEYLDENRVVTTAINLVAYPANFLLDEKGVIIKKDLTPAEVFNFLDENLSK
jgi:peroxiredoxin